MRSEPPRWQRWAVAGLLTCQAVLLLIGIRKNFVTIDEAGHVPAGLSHWQTGTFAAYRVNPPLPRMLATLPVLAARPNVPALPNRPFYARLEWDLGPAFADANPGRYFDLVCLARLAGVGWALLGGWLVFHWARELYGDAAGLLALSLWCFEPNILAHAQLVTPDVPAAVAGLAATYLFWRYLRRPNWGAAWFAGLVLGVAELTKFTWLILYAVWPLLGLVWWKWGQHKGPLASSRSRAGQVALIFVLSVITLNVGYGWQGTGQPLGKYRFVSQLFAGERSESSESGNRFHDHWLGRCPMPLPADDVRGIDLQRRDFEAGWPFFLHDDWQRGGWWYFYFYALAVKVPLGILILYTRPIMLSGFGSPCAVFFRCSRWQIGQHYRACVLVGAALLLTLARRPAGLSLAADAMLWLPAVAVLLLVSFQTGLNYLRYALPLFPFVLVAVGRMGVWCAPGRCRIGAVVLLAGWSAVSSLAVFPHSLSYFNKAAGGPAHGHELLADSNLDWGQDLLYLKTWLDEHPEARPLKLAYFNHVDPRVAGIAFRLPPFDPTEEESERFHPRPGWYAVSVYYVQGGSFTAPDGTGRWLHVPLHAYAYLQAFQPVARAGYSIWIYRIAPGKSAYNPARRRRITAPSPLPPG